MGRPTLADPSPLDPNPLLAVQAIPLSTQKSGKEKTHKHKQICGIVPGLGGCQKVVYVFFFCHSLWVRKLHKQNLPKIQDNPVKIMFMCFFLYVFFFSLPKNSQTKNRVSEN